MRFQAFMIPDPMDFALRSEAQDNLTVTSGGERTVVGMRGRYFQLSYKRRMPL
jgi:hypothetical protein